MYCAWNDRRLQEEVMKKSQRLLHWDRGTGKHSIPRAPLTSITLAWHHHMHLLAQPFSSGGASWFMGSGSEG